MAYSKVLGRERLKARIAALPEAIRLAAVRQMAIEVVQLAEAVKRAAPVGETGDLQASVRIERDGDTFAIAVGGPTTTKKVRSRKTDAGRGKRAGVSDADFAKALERGDNSGEFDYARAQEFGYRTHAGVHVPAQPFLYPTYRARKRGMKRRVNAAAKKAIKQLFPGVTDGGS